MAASTSAGFETRNDTQRGSITSPSLERGPAGPSPGARRSAADQVAELALDDQLREVLVGQALAAAAGGGRTAPDGRPGRARRRNARTARGPTSCSSPATRSVSTTRPSDGTRSPAGAQVRAESRVQVAGPQACLVHHAEAVGEPRVLGRREDPARALKLADPPQALEPGRVEEVLFGDVLGAAGRRRRSRPPRAASSARCSRGSGR